MSTYNIKTNFGAAGDGVTDDGPAFSTFNSSAINDVGLVTLTIPNGIYNFKTGNNQFWAKGISNLLVLGGGSGTTSLLNGLGTGQAYFLGGFGVHQDNSHSARTATSVAGTSTIQLLTVGQTSLFTAGNYALITGIDLQGQFQAPFGFPQNPHFFEYVLVTNVDSVGGVITVSAPLKNTYKSTWPTYNAGNAFEIDNGGPATLYAVDPSWNASVEYRDLTIDNPNFQTYANAKSVIYRNCVFTGTSGAVPTQTKSWQLFNCILTNCNMEIDKLIEAINLDTVTINEIFFQSSSTDLFTANNLNVTNIFVGTPKKAVITNSTLNEFRPGAADFGASTETDCTNCIINTFTPEGVNYAGWDTAVDTLAMTGGVISSPNGANVTGTSNNGAGLIRLAVDSTSGFTTGKFVKVENVFGTGVNGASVANGIWAVTVIDGTHVDLQGSSFVSDYISSGEVQGGSLPFAVPGAYAMFGAANGLEPAFQILDVTQDANFTHVATTRSGGFPSDASGIRVHPSPKITMQSCTGCPDVVSLSSAPAGIPLYAYQTRTYTSGTAGATVQPVFNVWGALKSISLNVVHSYSGAGSLFFHLSEFDNWQVYLNNNTWVPYAPVIDMKVAGNRIITPTSVVGGQTNDTGLTAGQAFWFGGTSFSGPQFSSDVGGTDPSVSIIVTIQTDQGIIFSNGFRNLKGDF